jgi:protein TonB
VQRWPQSIRQNWATPASVGLHAVVIVGFLIQFAQPAPSLPADSPTPSLAVEVMLMPTDMPDIVNTAPPPPPPPPPMPEVVEDPPPLIESVAELAPAAPPPPPPEVKKRPDPPKPTPVKRPPLPIPDSVPSESTAEPPPAFVPPTQVKAPQANQLALAAPAGRAGPPPNYLSIISSQLERNKVYPRAARDRRQQGRARLRFTIDRQGNVLGHELLSSAGYALLDQEVRSLIQRVSPLPPMPADMPQETLELTVSIDFFLR